MKRLVAKKIRIYDLVNGKFFSGSKEDMKASYVITPFGETVSRVNIFGSVTDKFENDGGTYSTVTIDDGSEAISFRVFNSGMLKGVDIGDMVVAIGNVKEWSGERYIGGEIAKKIDDRNYETYRRLELLKKIMPMKSMVEELRRLAETASQDELREYANSKYDVTEEMLGTLLGGAKLQIDYKSKVLELIVTLDNGSGVDIPKIFEMSKLPENVVESAINKLLEEGSLYEPIAGKFRKV